MTEQVLDTIYNKMVVVQRDRKGVQVFKPDRSEISICISHR